MKLDTNIFEFDNYRDFIRKVVQQNVKKKGKAFGYRHISGLLKWPPTYLNDLVNNRKKLSISKSWELSLLFGFDSLEKDYLTLLCLKESKSKSLKIYAEKSLKDWTLIKKHQITNEKPALHFNILVPVILRIIFKLDAQERTEKNILLQINKSPIGDLFSEAEILMTLQILVEMNYLNIHSNTYVLNKLDQEIWGEFVGATSHGWKMQSVFAAYASCWQQFMKNREDENFHLKSSFCLLNLEQMKMIAKKIDELRDLTLNFDRKNTKENIKNEKLSLVLYNYNLLEIVKNC